MRLALPSIGPVIKVLLVLNVLVFLVQAFGGSRLSLLLGANVKSWWQVWRYVTMQFLHGGPWHLFMNMLGLAILGSPLERHFGSRRFTGFYLLCGAVAGVFYVTVGALVRIDPSIPIIGASGGVYGIIVAAAVYFPSFKIIFLFFPVPIRVAAVFIFAIMGFTLVEGVGSIVSGGGFGAAKPQFWSDVAHLGGAVTGGIWVALRQRGPAAASSSLVAKIKNGRWQKKMAERQKVQAEADRILEKIHEHGIASLTGREKRTLKKATDQQRDEERSLRTRGFR